MTFIAFLIANKASILGALLAVSEVLGLIPSVKSNSIYEVTISTLSKLLPPKEY